MTTKSRSHIVSLEDIDEDYRESTSLMVSSTDHEDGEDEDLEAGSPISAKFDKGTEGYSQTSVGRDIKLAMTPRVRDSQGS